MKCRFFAALTHCVGAVCSLSLLLAGGLINMAVSTLNTDVLTAVLGRSIPLAYGRHMVGGNIVLKNADSETQDTIFVALGEGVWDAVEALWINGAAFDVTLIPGGPSGGPQVHFHRGLPGEFSSGGDLAPEGVGAAYPFTADGDQKADTFTPAGLQGLTFSRTAYLAIQAPYDIYAPNPGLSILGRFRTRKVSIRDAGGSETSFAYSENPAWQIADLLTSVRGLPTSRIDWQSVIDAAAYCDDLITIDAQQVKRFVSHIAFTEEVDFDEALEALLATCRGYLLDAAGKISLRIDQARSSVFDFDMNNIAEGSFACWYEDTRATPNRLELIFRDTDNDFAVVNKAWNHSTQQARIGREIAARLHLGNMPAHQAERIGNYLLTRAIDNNLFCRLRAPAFGSPASFAVMPGDVVRVKHDAAWWSQSEAGESLYLPFEVIEVTENPDETRDFLLRVYNANTYSDAAGPSPNLAGGSTRVIPALAAGDVTGISASEGPTIAADGGVASRVTFSFTKPSPLGTWAGVEIYAVGYQGGTKPVLIAKGNDSPLKVDLQTTNELITVYFVSFNARGQLNAILTSPSTTVLLDGQVSAPATPSNFTGQNPPDRAANVILTWSENVEADISHYEVARRTSAGTPTDAEIIGTVAAAGENATRKAQFIDTPGVSAASLFYYVRAVNRSGLASAWAGPASITAHAPDGTTDTGVPLGGIPSGGSWAQIWGTDTGNNVVRGALVLEYTPPVSFPASHNEAGVYAYRFKWRTTTNSGGTANPLEQEFEFPFDPLKPQRFVLQSNNRYVDWVKVRQRNYFGYSSEATLFDPSVPAAVYMGSAAEDAKPPSANFDPATQHYGATRITAKSGSNLELATTDAGATVKAVSKPIDTDVGYRVANAAPLANYLRGNGSNGVWAAIATLVNDFTDAGSGQAGKVSAGAQSFSGFKTFLNGAGLRTFSQSTRPTLGTGEICIWFDSGIPNRFGLLGFDGANYIYVAINTGTGEWAGEVNP